MILDFLFFVTIVIIAAQALAQHEGRAIATETKRKASPKVIHALAQADSLYADKRFRSAEKAYLEVLKLDHKNISAYNHLGIIYSKLKNYPDAIECFQIATQLLPSAGTYHNLGLVYYENQNYIKAISAYEKSIMFEPSAQRYVALGKAFNKISDMPKVISALEQAVKLAPANTRNFHLLLDAYIMAKQPVEAVETAKRLLILDPQDAKSLQILKRYSKLPQSA